MKVNTKKHSFAALVLSVGLVLTSCGDQLALEPQQPATPTAQATPQPSAAVQQSSRPNGDTFTNIPQASASASPLTQLSGGVFTPNQAPGEQEALSEYESIVNRVYQRNINAVVNLSSGGATGSGFVIDPQGYIVTNNHVVQGMQRITVTFADRSRDTAQLVGTFPDGDIAVVKVDQLPVGVQPVELGDSSHLQIGQVTVAIGSPLGLQQTVTSGIVSALNRSLEDLGERNTDSSLQGLIQTDASINPGNSGGPLFNGRGQVIGMNTLIASLNQGNVGLGFAVPVNRIKRVARQLIERREYRRPRMGVSVVPIQPELAEQFNLPTSGVMIAEATQGEPAAQAGLRGATRVARSQDGTAEYPIDGDVIVAIDGIPVRTLGDLRNILETEHDAGDTITITFVREGREQQTQLTLAS
jgi:2-alkenal reductase